MGPGFLCIRNGFLLMHERESVKERRDRRRTRNLVQKHSPYKPKKHATVKKYNRRSLVVFDD